MNKFIDKIWDYFNFIGSIVIALLRLFLLVICFFFSALQVILFSRTEICNIEMKGCPLRCDKRKIDDKLSYVDKLMLENPGLLDLPEAPLTEEEMRAIEDFENEEEENDDDNEGL